MPNDSIIQMICNLAKENNDPYKFGVKVAELLYSEHLISAETKTVLIDEE